MAVTFSIPKFNQYLPANTTTNHQQGIKIVVYLFLSYNYRDNVLKGDK
jgi:hypothetical protein